ncbi:MAG: hypothetical protein IJU84_06615, partial [Clostridia bacterium]|nr:hypothetical protein [Clostridia bacterium]
MKARTKKITIVQLFVIACACFCASLFLTNYGKANAEGEIKLPFATAANYCSSEVTEATFNEIPMKGVSSVGDIAYWNYMIRYAASINHVDVLDIVGNGTAGDPSSYTGAFEFYVYADTANNPSAVILQ